MKTVYTFCLILLCTVMISACQSSRNPSPDAPVRDTPSVNRDTTNYSALQNVDRVWTLYYITGPRISFNGLYPGRRPTLQIDMEQSRISGSTGCNQYGSDIRADAATDSFRIVEPLRVTEMYCESAMQGETTYLNILKKVNRYSLRADSLTLLMDDMPMLSFVSTNPGIE